MTTEIVYVCSENYWRYLYLSLRTLFWSNPEVEKVRIFVVSEHMPRWRIDDPRVEIEPVPDIGARGPWGYYWGNNKIHLCRSEAQRVVYLDTDAMILKPLSCVWSGIDEDLIARPAPETYRQVFWKPERWRDVMKKAGAPADYPFYSPGFIVFQNGAQNRIEWAWHDVINQILSRQLPLPANKHAEMYAFSIAAGTKRLSHTAMRDEQHRYAMIGEDWEDAVVYHLGTPGFYRYYLPLESRLRLNRKSLPVPRPPFSEIHAIYSRVRHRLRRKFARQRREASLEY